MLFSPARTSHIFLLLQQQKNASWVVYAPILVLIPLLFSIIEYAMASSWWSQATKKILTFFSALHPYFFFHSQHTSIKIPSHTFFFRLDSRKKESLGENVLSFHHRIRNWSQGTQVCYIIFLQGKKAAVIDGEVTTMLKIKNKPYYSGEVFFSWKSSRRSRIFLSSEKKRVEK